MSLSQYLKKSPFISLYERGKEGACFARARNYMQNMFFIYSKTGSNTFVRSRG